MNERRSGFWNRVHSFFFLIWLLIDTIIASTMIILLGLVSKTAARKVAWLWAWLLIKLGRIKLISTGLEKLDRGKKYIFAANHSSSIDIPILYTCLPFAICFIAKKELFFFPLFGWAMAALGHVSVDRSHPKRARKSIEKANLRLRAGRASLVLFPEGTRTRTGELGSFKLGGFSLAIKTGFPIVPVAVQGTFHYLPKGSYLILPSAISVSVADPIPVSSLGRTDKAALADKVKAEIERLLES
jgi:1-acyl-sn-glycerol-3-phosphate acyltransferase